MPPTHHPGFPGSSGTAGRRARRPRPARALATAAVAMALALMTAACTSSHAADPGGGPGATDPDRAGTTASGLPAIDLASRPGPFQLTVDQVPAGVTPGTVLEVADDSGRSLGRATVDANGTALWRDLPPGPAHLYVLQGDQRVAEGHPATVPGDEPPPESTYRTTRLDDGFGYIPTRDGTTLSAFVSLPGPADQGPYPTLVEYSGYSPSRPDGFDPSRTLITNLGYALVQVNVRGTGCSGGSFDAFEAIESLDGYDVIQTVAAQPWAGKVGMYGSSYAGIMQLLVAATRPPELTAIAPLQVLDQVGSVAYPGGIYNTGFATLWTRQVADGARANGQGWEQGRAANGDTTCAANQRLRGHNPDLLARLRTSPFDTALQAARSPITNAGQINVPTFLSGAWQDEQTGGQWPALIPALTGVPVLRAVLYNGTHADALSPDVLADVTYFYGLYLDAPAPDVPAGVTQILSAGLSRFYGRPLTIPFQHIDTSQREALRQAYQAQPPVHVHFEQGATAANLPVKSFAVNFAAWPPPQVQPTALPLAPGGTPVPAGASFALGGPTPDQAVSRSFTTVPAQGAQTTAPEPDRIWTADPGWRWPAPAPGHAVVATTAPLPRDQVLVGPASADLWVSADATDADLQATLSEVAPDGSETYIQSGWLRLSERALDPSSTVLRPVLTRRPADVAPLTPGGAPVLARVAIQPFAHVLRAGSRLRLTVDTPGASQPLWRFDVLPTPARVTVTSGRGAVSQLVVPVVPGVDVPTPRPACGTLRAQPCRPPT